MCNGWQKQVLWSSGIQTKRRMCQTCNKVNGWQLWVARRSVKEYNGKNLEDGKGSGGNGRLKNARNDPMQNFYGSSIHDNKADVPKMSAEVMGKARITILRVLKVVATINIIRSWEHQPMHH